MITLKEALVKKSQKLKSKSPLRILSKCTNHIPKIWDKMQWELSKAFFYKGIDINRNMIDPAPRLKKLGLSYRPKEITTNELYLGELGIDGTIPYIVYKSQEEIPNSELLVKEITDVLKDYNIDSPNILLIYEREENPRTTGNLYLFDGHRYENLKDSDIKSYFFDKKNIY